jgi:DNA-binding GntR family transcriptional regulator
MVSNARAASDRPDNGSRSPVSGRGLEIAEILTGEILRGERAAKSALRQAPLAERFEVSRTPVREALHQLVAVGLATFHPNSGFRVRGISREEYLDAMLIRSRLEGLAAERATMRVTTKQMSRLETLIDELDTLGARVLDATGSRYLAAQEAWSEKNENFHDLVVEFAECPPLAVAMSTTLRSYPRDVTWLALERFPVALIEYADDHKGICDALRRCDPELARSRARMHVERALHYLRLVFDLDDAAGDGELDG